MAQGGGYIPESIIEEVKSKADIESVVGSYVTFTKRTGQNLFGLCPFHSEKTPSFSVSLVRGTFHCFGCGKGGDSITFIQEIEHKTYPEAVRFLGSQYGVDVPERGGHGDSKETNDKKERIRAILKEAARYYYSCLIDPKIGKIARDYILKRGLSPATSKHFGLGYAPSGFNNLYSILVKKGFTEDELLNSGLFVRSSKNNKIYDLFHDRLMFPIFDSMGKLIAFGGRTLIDDSSKYVNSPDSLVYNKKEHFYGLNFAKENRPSQLIIVEGYMDTIAMHQAGVTNAVASLGTAFTEQQLRLASKYANEIVFFFDADNAGQKAAIRAIEMILSYMRRIKSLNVRVKIAKVPNAKDPDEFIREFGKDEFKKVVDDAVDIDKYLLNKAYEDNINDGVLDDFNYQKDIIRYGSMVTDAVKRDRMAAIASTYLNANPSVIVERMKDAEIELRDNDLRQEQLNERRREREQQETFLDFEDSPETTAESVDDDDCRVRVNSLSEFAVQNRIPKDIAYKEEIDLLALALLLGKDLASDDLIKHNWIITQDDFAGENMKNTIWYILNNFDDDAGLDMDQFQAFLMRFTFNGRNARDVIMEAYKELKTVYSEYNVIHDMYLKSLFMRRVAALRNALYNDMVLLSNTPPNMRETINSRIKVIQKNIDAYEQKIRELDGIK